MRTTAHYAPKNCANILRGNTWNENWYTFRYAVRVLLLCVRCSPILVVKGRPGSAAPYRATGPNIWPFLKVGDREHTRLAEEMEGKFRHSEWHEWSLRPLQLYWQKCPGEVLECETPRLSALIAPNEQNNYVLRAGRPQNIATAETLHSVIDFCGWR